ncbi:MAG: hypothetical protein ACMVY4_17455 [Minwuia sp.]|uniref:hypothetical protein n=1 Tax=Minwuia sp. TaxID=2493630 RepID=UPI003A86424C
MPAKENRRVVFLDGLIAMKVAPKYPNQCDTDVLSNSTLFHVPETSCYLETPFGNLPVNPLIKIYFDADFTRKKPTFRPVIDAEITFSLGDVRRLYRTFAHKELSGKNRCEFSIQDDDIYSVDIRNGAVVGSNTFNISHDLCADSGILSTRKELSNTRVTQSFRILACSAGSKQEGCPNDVGDQIALYLVGNSNFLPSSNRPILKVNPESLTMQMKKAVAGTDHVPESSFEWSNWRTRATFLEAVFDTSPPLHRGVLWVRGGYAADPFVRSQACKIHEALFQSGLFLTRSDFFLRRNIKWKTR